MTRTPGSPAQAEVLAVLCEAAAPLSTREVRELVNRQRSELLVAEPVYRRLLALPRHGLVRRVDVAGKRNTHWQCAAGACREVSWHGRCRSGRSD
jgi:Fe2+ or Zn2+ uptake regulation protein